MYTENQIKRMERKAITQSIVYTVLGVIVILIISYFSSKVPRDESVGDKITFTTEDTNSIGFIVFQPVDPNGNDTGSLEMGVWVDDNNQTVLQVFDGELQLAVQKDGVWTYPLQVVGE